MASSSPTTSPTITSAPLHCRNLSSSSPQIPTRSQSPAWADENYDPNPLPEHFGSFSDAHGNIISAPAPVTTTLSQSGRSRSIGHDEELVTPRLLTAHHQKPLTALQPIQTNITYTERTIPEPNSASQSHSSLQKRSPSQQEENEHSMPAFTGDKNTAQAAPARGLAGWFSNLSTPPDESTDDSNPNPSTTISASGKLHKLATPPLASATKPKFSFFASKPPPPAPPPEEDEDADPLLSLSIPSALTPIPHDPFSPASSKNLHASALALLSTFQSALRARTSQIHELRADAAARAEERDAADTRTMHLKAQLAEMAARVAEQEGTLKSILGELVEERRKGAEERERSAKRVSLSPSVSVADRMSGSSEDLGVGRWKGNSAGAVEESDAESAVGVCGVGVGVRMGMRRVG